MSDNEEKDNTEKAIAPSNQDGGSSNPETITEGNVLSLDTNKNTENSSTVSENMPRSAAIEGSGDNAGRIIQENSELDEIEAELTEMSKELINTDERMGSGDYTAKTKISDIDDKIIEEINTVINAKTSKTDVTAEKDDLLDKCDDIGLKKADEFDDEDEDMQLRWDEDDDASNQLEGDDNANVADKNDSVLSEDKLLEDSSDVLIEKGNLESVTLRNSSKESETSPKLDIHTDKADLEKSLEEELLEEPDVNNEAIEKPETACSAEDQDFLDDKILEDSEMNSNTEFIAQAKEIIDVKNMKQLKKDELTHSAETSQITFSNNDVLAKDNLLKEPDSKDESSEIIPVKDTESSDNIPEKEFPMNKELDDDVLLEEKLLEEPEMAEVIPEIDETMDFDDENEAELLKDDGGQNKSSTPMDVDSMDPSIEDQAKIEDKIIDQPMDDESEVGKKETALTNLEKVDTNQTTDEIKVMNESDAQLQMTEKIIHQPVEGTTKTIEFIKDIPVEEKSATVEFDKETAIENQAKKDKLNIDLAPSEMEIVNQPMNDEKNMVENSKVQLIVETNTTEESIKTPEQSDALTVSNIPNIEIEEQENSISDKSTLEKEIESKEKQEQPKLNTETVDIHNEKPEKSKEIAIIDTSLDKNNVPAEVSPSSSSIFRDSLSPIKSFHGINKPDVMLEIPTQELIDMDMTDLSMNLDQSEVLDSNDRDHYIKKELDDDNSIDMSIPEDDTATEKSVDNIITKVVDDTANQKTVDQDTILTETKADKIITKNDTANEKSVDQETTATKATVGEVPIESKIEKSGKKDETVVEPTIEQNMEILFADDEPEVAKVVPECIASTSKTLEQPSTSTTQMTADTSDEVPDAEVSDSLGLLAESTRVMEDDEENEDDDEGDGDDDDDFDQDESSNQVSAEQSEDSNPPAIESEPVTETEDKELESPPPKESEFPFLRDSYSQDKGDKVHMEYGTMELQAEAINEMTEEATSAVAALLNADKPVTEETKAPKETPVTQEEMDIETVKLSDTSDNEADVEPAICSTVDKTVAEAESSKEVKEEQKKSPSKSPLQSDASPKQSPSKLKNLAITTQAARSVVNIVDLEESSSSDDDIQEMVLQKQPSPEPETKDDKPASPDPDSEVTSVNIPTGIDIIRSVSSGGITSEITTKDGEAVISGVPKPPPHKPARLNTSEVSIKTVSSAEPMVIPEAKINEQTPTQAKPQLNLEIFSLDSDEEDSSAKEKPATEPAHEMTPLVLEKTRETSKCINYSCTSDNTVPYRVAEASELAYYDANRKKRAQVCQPCAAVVADRTKNLIQGMKDLTPLLELDMRKSSQELVEISDSDSEDENMNSEDPKETIGKEGAKILEDSLSQFLNDTWKKYKMDARLKETQIMLDDEIEKLEQDSKEIDEMLKACQVATDKLRNELYATFECRLQELPALIIQDTPEKQYIAQEEQATPPAVAESAAVRHAKRRLSSNTNELPAKRPAIPLGYAPLDSADAKEKAAIPVPESKMDDDKDISVVKLSAEAAPADLPPPGEISRPPLRVGMPVFAMKNAFGPFLKGKVLEIQPKNAVGGNPFSLCRVRFDHKAKSNGKVLQARSIAYAEPADVRMTIGTRLIALFKDSNKRESYYSGVVAEIPNPVNNYRYLVFFDDGYAQYVQHQFTRLVCESSHHVWDEVHPFSREFVHNYLKAYPERPMVRLHTGQHLKTEWNGKWWPSRVTRVDASLAQVMFVEDGRREWIYRGSTRLAPLYLELQAAERHRPRPLPRGKAPPRLNMPYVEYIRSDEQEAKKSAADVQAQVQQEMQQQQLQRDEEIRRQRAVAKKSTSAPPQVYPPAIRPPLNTDPVTSRVVYYTPKNAVRPLKMVPHRCTPKCKRSDVLSLKELRTYNPLAKPLLSGWERQIVRFKGHKDVMYRAPCGRRIRNMRELHHYLRSIDSDLPVDLFDFHYSTHCLAEFVLNKCLVGKKDLSHGKENVPVPCVNYYDDSLPEFCSYNTERTPTAGVPLNLEPEFLCGCDCTDDCQDKSKCACWKMTLEGARTIGLTGTNIGYVYKRLPEPLPSGIYECNSRCKCKHTCLNRVAQHPLQLKLQVFKTPNRGWGIRALNDVPKGSFLCVYAGNLLTDATANLDGLNEGDEYLAELDYIEVVEQMKEGYEEDIPESNKKLDKKESGKDGEDSDEEPSSSSEDEGNASKSDKEDDDFRPGSIGLGVGVAEFNKRLRKREKSKKDKEKAAADDKDKDTTKDNKEPKEEMKNGEDDCITISDDEEVREPSRFMAQTKMGANEYISKYKSVRTLFGKDEACYIMDAKVQGNIGRYLNHSCCPNVFVQNVFVDTHDPRFPWVAFFALSHIKAGTELTWNYNYDVGSVPGKVLYCYCGAVNCRGRLL